MKKQVKIKIISRQIHSDGELFEPNDPTSDDENKIVVSNSGTMELDGGKYILKYEETELTGMPNTVTSIQFDDADRAQLIMNRGGQVNTTMYFAEGKRYVTKYDTGIMPLNITLCTSDLKNGISWTGGKAHIEYDIEIHGMCAEHTVLDIEVT